ncbi:hybrid sensor histidine kinase/response regulator transcription factor [Spongiivirga citrea]|uniref:histidine kinase n=1 Tax=Spongiivirga citrea TaxID=1481457 RepID=A0A6M0CHX7_9FLAO|nr:hybrid sensor histidine kinase/response regulator transcription factor [Spongiivirga citrea]NER16553.1 response regulator [Spongiivirga citrea]
MVFIFLRLNRLTKIALPFFLLLSTVFSNANAQIALEDFNNAQFYTVKNGLPSSFTSDIAEDQFGFLWIATAKGIVRFDGKKFSDFSKLTNDKLDKIGFVNTLITDKSGEDLWLASDDGIFYSNTATINFQRIESLISSIPFPIEKIADIILDHQKIIWAAEFDQGLVRIDLEGNTHKRILFKNSTAEGNSKLNSITNISQDPIDNNILWLGTGAGLIRFNSLTNDYDIYVYQNHIEAAQNHIRNIHASKDEVLIGTWSEGVLFFDKSTREFRQPLKKRFPNYHRGIKGFHEDTDGTIWVTTVNGLMSYNSETRDITNIVPNNLDKDVLRGVSFVDSRGIIWYANNKGLLKYDPLPSQTKFIELESRSELSEPVIVNAIIKAENNLYVLGHAGLGLYKINLTDHSFKVIRLPYLNGNKKTGYSLRDMIEMEDGRFLILGSHKMVIFNPKTEEVVLSPLQIDHVYPSLQKVIKDRDNNYWVGARQGGVFCLNFQKNSIVNYREEFDIYEEGNHRWVNRLYLDSKNKLWLGKGSSSTIMNLNDLSIHNLDPVIQDSINSYTDVGGFLEDNKGRVWIAGYKQGLGYTDYENFAKGISHEIDGYYRGLYPLNDSIFWTIGDHLGQLNTNTLTHTKMNLRDTDNQYVFRGPVINSKHNEYIIGCNNGVLIYNSTQGEAHSELAVPYIQNVSSNGTILFNAREISRKNLQFKSGIQHLMIQVSALGFHKPDQINYQYTIGDDWIDIGVSNEINFTNLSSGDYAFQLRAVNSLGQVQENPVLYNLTIPTPWWATWTAYLLYGLAALIFAYWFYRFKLSKKLAVAESKRLIEMHQFKNSLYTNITHEFRTPLTVILGLTDSLKTRTSNLKTEDSKTSLQMIERNGENLLRLVNEMLDLSKLESGHMELQLAQTNVVPLLKYLAGSFSSLAEENELDLTIYSEIEHLVMDIDVTKLTSIISNVLSNAIKFTPALGQIIVHIKQYVHKSEDYLYIKIKDSGIGISEEEIPNIFQRFYQADISTTRINTGTGIGLALTKELVTLMNGSISLKSTLGKGSEFTIKIPVTQNAPVTPEIVLNKKESLVNANTPVITTEKSLIQNPKLPIALVIEDNMDVAHYLKTCLWEKYEVIHAVNGLVGIEMAFDHMPDVIISDVMMPEKNGFEVCKTLKLDERTDHIPIIILTAKVSTKDRLEGLSHGADAYLGKPFNKTELYTRLDQLLLVRKKLINKIHDGGYGSLVKKAATTPETRFLQKSIKLIHTEMDNSDFGPAELAKKLHLSESQVYRKIKAITHKSTAVFIRSVRLQKAKELIETTDKTISETAYEVGFNDPSWFSRAFKKEFGLAPSELVK